IVPMPTDYDLDSNNWDYNVIIYPKYTRSGNQITTAQTTVVTTNTPPPDTNPPPPDNPPTPETPSENPPVEIPDEPVPLVYPPSDTPEEIIPDEPIPLGVPKIPKSGLLWWPVPVLGIAGVGLLIGGAILRRKEENNG
ncbi:MAG: hypothetical protein IJT56_11565, partial [Clostridia bacterium]|nr:hypothetical protein [Clostridia bacterium]